MNNSLLPPNSTQTERAIEAVTARLGDVPCPVRSLWDAWTCPAALLPWLAWALAVDQWEATWTEPQKRATLAAAIRVHQHKGTPGAMKTAIAALGYELKLSEWWQLPGKDPGTFGIDIRLQGAQDASATRELLETVNVTKNARSHFWGLTYRYALLGTQVAAAAQSFGLAFTIDARPLADKAALTAALASAASKAEASYTPESWAPLAAAVTAGQDVANDFYAWQSEVDAATAAITAAVAGLVAVTPSADAWLWEDGSEILWEDGSEILLS